MYRYLIVDDEPMMRFSIRFMLEEAGLTPADVVEAENGVDALEKLAEQPIDFAFIDINMPKMSGMELARRICDRYPGVAMCIISGYDEFRYAQEAIRFGVKEYLLKPVNSTQLGKTVESMMQSGKRSASQRLPHSRMQEHIGRLTGHLYHGEMEKAQQSVGVLLEEISGFSPDNAAAVVMDIAAETAKQLSAKLGEDTPQLAPLEGRGRDALEAWLLSFAAEQGRRMAGVRKSPYHSLIEKALRMLEGESGWNISLEEIAASLGVNPNYFSQVFREETGSTFVNYRTEIRMQRAKDLLRNLEKPIASVTYEVGYSDVTHFTRVFKKHVGMLPSEYRKQERH